jgi:hypothetical protein
MEEIVKVGARGYFDETTRGNHQYYGIGESYILRKLILKQLK